MAFVHARYDVPAGYNLWNASTYRMRLFDVGQSSALAMESEALAAIASVRVSCILSFYILYSISSTDIEYAW